MSGDSSNWRMWRQALTHWGVWRRSLMIGLPVGAVQIMVNQGDHWLRMQVSTVVVIKTLVTPLIGVSVALLSAAGAYVELQKQRLQQPSKGFGE